jgi:hypothetical protein
MVVTRDGIAAVDMTDAARHVARAAGDQDGVRRVIAQCRLVAMR